MERTLIILKPDAVHRRLCGRIIQRFEDKGLRIVGMKLMRVSPELAVRHYGVHKGKPFYESLVGFMTGGPVIVMAVEGARAIEVSRRLMGKTFGYEAEPGTIRGDFGISRQFNLVHGSDGSETAAFELELYFRPEELVTHTPVDAAWVEGE